MIKADVLITNKNWESHIGIPNFYINRKLKKIDKSLKIFKKNNFKFTILLSGDDEIINLNKMIPKITNKDFLFNFDKIWIHGLAHLLGHRHKLDRDFFMMKKLENKLIKFSK